MDIYEELAVLDGEVKELGISPLSYVSLGCAR